MSSAVVLVSAGGTNLTSVVAAFKRLGVSPRVSSEPDVIRSAERVILPGVGAAAPALTRLSELGIRELLTELSQPVLGICLGMQLLYSDSEEGDTDCLGLLPGTVSRLRPGPYARVPHMGWNRLELLSRDPLLEGAGTDPYAYFVHSYAAPVTDFSLAAATHGQRFSAVVRRGNFWGTQFHPERSGRFGALILRNFLEVTPDA